MTDTETPYADFGAWLRAQRIQRNLSQQQLGDVTGLAQGTISVWERGIQPPNLRNQQRLAAGLGIDVSLIRAKLGFDTRPYQAAEINAVTFRRGADDATAPATFLDALIGSFAPLTEREQREITGIVRGYLESRRATT